MADNNPPENKPAKKRRRYHLYKFFIYALTFYYSYVFITYIENIQK